VSSNKNSHGVCPSEDHIPSWIDIDLADSGIRIPPHSERAKMAGVTARRHDRVRHARQSVDRNPQLPSV
jgi:hypothetical protein